MNAQEQLQEIDQLIQEANVLGMQDSEQTETSDHELSADVEEQMLMSMLFENAGKTFYSDSSMGDPVDDTAFFTEEKSSKGGSGLPQLDESDFECQPAFLYLKEKINCLVNKKTSRAARAEAGAWVFSDAPGEEGLSFDLCCKALSMRPNLLRVRTQFEFYRLGVVFEEPLPLNAVSVPDYFNLEVAGLYGTDGMDIAEYVWAMPGLRADKLVELMGEMNEEEMHDVIRGMERRGIISIQGGYWYFTGRNPLAMKQGSCFHWSKLVGL